MCRLAGYPSTGSWNIDVKTFSTQTTTSTKLMKEVCMGGKKIQRFSTVGKYKVIASSISPVHCQLFVDDSGPCTVLLTRERARQIARGGSNVQVMSF